MKNHLLLILLSHLILFGCEKPKTEKSYVPVVRCSDRTRNMDTINLYIQGNWEWVEEYRVSRYGAKYITPDSPGESHINLKLSGDTARFFINGMADSVYKFRIQRELEITNYSTDSLPVIVYYRLSTGRREAYVPIMICKNQLLMQHQYVSSIVGERLWIRK